MINIDAVLNELARNNSRIFKETLLEKHKDEELLEQVVFLALDSFTQFYIRKIPTYKSEDNPKIDLQEALDRLELLSSRKLTGHAGIDWLRETLESLDPADALVIERIIKKDLKCGVSSSTANKIWPGLVRVYPVMLSSAYDEKLIKKVVWSDGVYIQTKEDGMRANAIVKDGAVSFKSRNGKDIDILGNLESDFISLSMECLNFVFDGEMLVVDENENPLPRKEGNGILNKAIKGTISAKEAAMIRFKVWDMIPYNDFLEEKHTVPYSSRFLGLSAIVNSAKTDKIKLVDNDVVYSLDEAIHIFKRYLAQGKEGVIIKTPDSIWENKRSKKNIKMKNELECDLLCTGWEPGEPGTKYENLLGSLVMQTSDGVIKVNVGTGLKDEDRTNPERYVGKIHTIKYNERITKKDGGDQSLFLPVYVEVREDKDTADTEKDVK